MGKICSQLLVVFVVFGLFACMPSLCGFEQPSGGTQVYVDPMSVSEPVDAQFTVMVGISEVVDLAGFDVKLCWDPAVLQYVSHTATPETILNPMVFTLANMADAAAGTYQFAAATLDGAPFTGSGVVYTVTLKVLAVGFSNLKFLTHDLADAVANPIPHIVVSGAFDNRVVPAHYELRIGATGSGTTNPAEGIHFFDEGSETSVEAFPGSGWRLSHWLLDASDVGDLNPFTVTMDGIHSLNAVFVEGLFAQYKLTISVVGSGRTDPLPLPWIHMYSEGAEVIVEALPSRGWMLDRWLLDSVDVGDLNPYTVTMDGNHSLMAVFEELPAIKYDLVISVLGYGTTTPAADTYTYNAYSLITVEAFPASDWALDHWLLDSVDVGGTNPYTVRMDGNHSLVAVFLEIVKYELVIGVSGSGTTTPAVGTHLYAEDSRVIVAALPAGGWKLDYWLLDSANVGSASPYIVTMDGNHSLMAVFVEVAKYELVIDVSGSGTTDPVPGAYLHAEGSQVAVRALPASGWMLSHWVLDAAEVGGTSPFRVTMDGNHSLTAMFVVIPPPPPTIRTTDGKGVERHQFNVTEFVYASGANFNPEESFTIYIVLNGDPLVQTNSVLNKTVQADASGSLSPVLLDAFAPGEYDVWADLDGNGVLGLASEPFDDFEVGTGNFVIPELFAGTVLGLLGCFAAFSIFVLSKRRK